MITAVDDQQVILLWELLGSIKQKAATILVNQFNCVLSLPCPGYKNIRDWFFQINMQGVCSWSIQSCQYPLSSAFKEKWNIVNCWMTWLLYRSKINYSISLPATVMLLLAVCACLELLLRYVYSKVYIVNQGLYLELNCQPLMAHTTMTLILFLWILFSLFFLPRICFR